MVDEPPKSPPPIDDGQNKIPLDAKQPKKRIPLKFPNLEHKAFPEGYILVDGAIDEIGQALFPDDWGMTPAFASLPFAFNKALKKFQRPSLTVERSKLRKRWVILTVERSERRAFRRCARQFAKAKKRLRSALETEQLSGFFLPDDGNPTQFTKLGIWAVQVRPIFMLGQYIKRDSGTELPCLVLIKKSTFDIWMKTPGNVEHGKPTKQPPMPKACLKEAIGLLLDRAKTKQYKFTNERFTDVVLEAGKRFELSRAWIETVLWRQLPKDVRNLNGKPKGPSAQNFRDDEVELTKALGQHIANWRTPGIFIPNGTRSPGNNRLDH